MADKTPAAPVPAAPPVNDRTPTSSFDAIARMAIDKVSELAYPIVCARLIQSGLDPDNAAQKTANLLGSAGDFAYDVVDAITDIKLADKLKAAAKG